MFLKAARHAELDILRGVSANVMCGQEGMYGTSSFQVVLDIEEMNKLKETSKFKFTNTEDQIDEMFGSGAEDASDPCAITNLTIQNNVTNIKTTNMGDDDDYEPGF